MSANTSNSWQELISTLQFTDRESYQCNPITDLDIANFEREHNFLLPSDYKEFCKLFGTGIAGNWLEIYCPDCSYLVRSQEGLFLTADYIRRFPSGVDEVDQQKINVLMNGFTIADDGCAHFLLWDLRTYSTGDLSYDLYWAVWDAPQSDNLEDDLKFVGRSFFNFVRDFCYGSRVNELYPDSKSGEVKREYRRLRVR